MRFYQVARGLFVGPYYLALPMADREVKTVNSRGEYATRFWIDREVHPAVLEPATLVRGKRNSPRCVISVGCGQHTELHKELEPIADAQYKAASSDELNQAIDESL